MQGERVGPYVISKELGSGGMGTVYDATHDDGRRVALKLVHQIQKDLIGDLSKWGTRSGCRGELGNEHHGLPNNRVDQDVSVH